MGRARVRVGPTLPAEAHGLGAAATGGEGCGVTGLASPPAASPVLGAVGAGRFWRGMGYLLGGLPLAIVAFVIAVAGFSAGVGTLVVWVGLPVLVLTLRAARGFAVVERRSTEWATGRPLPPHHYRGAGGGVSGGGSTRWRSRSRGGTCCTPWSASRSGWSPSSSPSHGPSVGSAASCTSPGSGRCPRTTRRRWSAGPSPRYP